MRILKTNLPGVLIIEPRLFTDSRGFFFESFHQQRYLEHGMTLPFVQDNISRSTQGALRGLHCQLQHTQGKLVWVARGAVFDVAVDIRQGSSTFGQSTSIILDDKNPRQLYIPPGFAHGFCVISAEADFIYKCTDYYHPASEIGIAWNDPDLNIPWPITDPVLSAKDQAYPRLRDCAPENLPKYTGEQ